MSERSRVSIGRIFTGIPGLDEVLGGSLPEYSFNMIAGGPGSGKTTLAQQIMFANATTERPALFFTVLGEPAIKMLWYQQQFSFFDHDKVGDAIRYINLSQEVVEQDLGLVLDLIVREVEAAAPGIVIVDSFRSVLRVNQFIEGRELDITGFVQKLAMHLTTWQATTFLIGEYPKINAEEHPVATIADGILWLTQDQDRNSIVRKMQVTKMRGRAHLPGMHTFRINDDGLQIFPRTFKHSRLEARPARPLARLATGIPGLDELLRGGFPIGDAVLVSGPSGSGKSAMATQFIAEGLKQGENAVIAVFEEEPVEYIARADRLGLGLREYVDAGRLSIIYLRSNVSIDEALLEIQDAVTGIGAKRLVIDSLSGFELALAPTFRVEFRESLYRMMGAMTAADVTVLMTVEVVASFSELIISPHEISFLTDAIVVQRYVEIEGQLRKVMMVVKLRRGDHSRDIRLYDIGPRGMVVGETLRNYRGIITGIPIRDPIDHHGTYPGLTKVEFSVLEALMAPEGARANEIGRATGLNGNDLTRALSRIIELGFATKEGEGSDVCYRASVPPAEIPTI